jgi:hypothetical protein
MIADLTTLLTSRETKIVGQTWGKSRHTARQPAVLAGT